MANAGNKIIQLDNDAVKLIVTIGDGISRETTVKTFFRKNFQSRNKKHLQGGVFLCLHIGRPVLIRCPVRIVN
ncbi:MAG: hypothetical protein ACI9TY_000789 [Alphaproteobacteria bacterium]|jgi:hypothetical protein